MNFGLCYYPWFNCVFSRKFGRDQKEKMAHLARLIMLMGLIIVPVWSFEDENRCVSLIWDVNNCLGKKKDLIGSPDVVLSDGGQSDIVPGSPQIAICQSTPCRTKTPGKKPI